MNTTCIIIGIVFLVFVLAGWIQGFFKLTISVAGLIISLILAFYFAPPLSGYIQKNTQLDDYITSYISKQMEFTQKNSEEEKGIQVEVINSLPLPKGIKENILNNNNSEMYEALNVISVYEYIAKSIAVIVLNTFVFLLILFVCRIFFYNFGKALGAIVKLPIVRWIDKIGGGCLGAIRGIITIWIFFLILSISSTATWSHNLIIQIHQSELLKLLYDHNILLDIVGDLTRILFL